MEKFNDSIFNEVKDVEISEMYNDPYLYDVLMEMKAKENDYTSFADVPDNQQDDIADTELINVKLLPANSMLLSLLTQYNGDSAINNMRSAVGTKDGIYFVTGTGYDWISSDLLDGISDGKAKHDFINWLNK